MKANANPFAAPQEPEAGDWVQNRLRAVPFNPYGPAMGGNAFTDNLFKLPPNEAARGFAFDRNAYRPEDLDQNGQLFPMQDPRERLIRALIK